MQKYQICLNMNCNILGGEDPDNAKEAAEKVILIKYLLPIPFIAREKSYINKQN